MRVRQAVVQFIKATWPTRVTTMSVSKRGGIDIAIYDNDGIIQFWISSDCSRVDRGLYGDFREHELDVIRYFISGAKQEDE